MRSMLKVTLSQDDSIQKVTSAHSDGIYVNENAAFLGL